MCGPEGKRNSSFEIRLLLVLGFNLFEVFVRRHGKLWRAGRVTLQELARQLDRALEAVPELAPLWSG